jgi:hypothetical protein
MTSGGGNGAKKMRVLNEIFNADNQRIKYF